MIRHESGEENGQKKGGFAEKLRGPATKTPKQEKGFMGDILSVLSKEFPQDRGR